MTRASRTSSGARSSRARLVLLVFVGGVLGTAAREAIVLAWPTGGGWPVAVLTVNLVGAFALGILVAALGGSAESPRSREVRTFAGTGLIGGFTTYSALATDTVLLLETEPALGVVYALGSVLAGVVCAGAGLLLGGRLRHPSSRDAA